MIKAYEKYPGINYAKRSGKNEICMDIFLENNGKIAFVNRECMPGMTTQTPYPNIVQNKMIEALYDVGKRSPVNTRYADLCFGAIPLLFEFLVKLFFATPFLALDFLVLVLKPLTVSIVSHDFFHDGPLSFFLG